ncbi:MAG: suppressor of fused domain protein [Burkholderiaceae bacterium]
MEDKKNKVVSLGGQPIYRHDEPNPWQAPQGEMCIEEISNHVEMHLGKIETVYHEIMSDAVHIDVLFVKPTETYPFVRLVTSGMSDLPMGIPDNSGASRYVELLMTLPADWKMDSESFKDDSWYWPIRLLKYLARLPHKHNTWLGYGHTIPNGDPAEPYADNTALNGCIVLPSVSVPDGFDKLAIDSEKEISFFSVVPLYNEEMNLKLGKGTNELLRLFDKKSITDIVDVNRVDVTKKRFGYF